MKISAMDFSQAGDKYLGRSYEEMDCQAFVEKCMADVGYPRDLGGSNSWYRECMKNGWTGTPEECMKQFGSVPKGALLFILEPVSASTPAKFRNDGIGDATHMGIVTGRNDGAIHSSKSRGGVVTSKFKGKTIPNGGWSRVGLLSVFDYGTTVNWVLDHIGLGGTAEQGTAEQGDGRNEGTVPPVPCSAGTEGLSPSFQANSKEEPTMNVIIHSENGGPVKLRQGNDPKRSGYSIWEEIPSGTKAEVLQSGENWSRIRVGSRTGWMMSKFLVTDDSSIPAEPELAAPESEECRVKSGDEVALLSDVYRILRDLCDKIERTIGEG